MLAKIGGSSLADQQPMRSLIIQDAAAKLGTFEVF